MNRIRWILIASALWSQTGFQAAWAQQAETTAAPSSAAAAAGATDNTGAASKTPSAPAPTGQTGNTVTAPLPPPDLGAQIHDVIRNEALPLSPEHNAAIRERVRGLQRALMDVNPEVVVRSVKGTLGPGSKPLEVHISPRHPVSIVFLDAAGKPWRVAAYTQGEKDVLHVTPSKATAGNILDVSTGVEFGSWAFSVTLEGTHLPLIFVARSDVTAKRVDGRLDVHLDDLAPTSVASASMADALSAVSAQPDPVLLHFLDGTPPEGASRLDVSPTDAGVAWWRNGTIYFRTRDRLVSPAALGRAPGPQGYSVYALPSVPEVLSLDGKGHIRTVVFGGIPPGTESGSGS